MDNQSYLRFVQGGSMPYDKVNVFVDNNPAFAATVDEPKKFRVKANTYVVKSGTRHVKVVHNGNTVYEKDVVVATQETKQIILP
jgi:hypothetical protein